MFFSILKFLSTAAPSVAFGSNTPRPSRPLKPAESQLTTALALHVTQRVSTPVLPSQVKFPRRVLQPVVCSAGCCGGGGGGAQMSLFTLAGINRRAYSAMKTNHSRARCPSYCRRRGNENVIWADLSHAPSCSSVCKRIVSLFVWFVWSQEMARGRLSWLGASK